MTTRKKVSKKIVNTEEVAQAQEPTISDAEIAKAASASKDAEIEGLRSQLKHANAAAKAATKKPNSHDDGFVERFGVRVKRGTILSDPFSSSNPHEFKTHPPGKRLYWCSATMRSSKGFDGFAPIKYDSELGRELGKYISSPPSKMEGVAGIDNYVRRGNDSILCWIPEEIWLYRQVLREQKSADKLRLLNNPVQDRLARDGTVIIGGQSLEDSERPEGGFRFKHEEGHGSRPSEGEQDLSDLIDADDTDEGHALHN